MAGSHSIISPLFSFLSRVISFCPLRVSRRLQGESHLGPNDFELYDKPDKFQRFTAILSDGQIKAERYKALTADGFEITLHRLRLKGTSVRCHSFSCNSSESPSAEDRRKSPCAERSHDNDSLKESTVQNAATQGQEVAPPSSHVIFFQHGLLESSLIWITGGERSLPFRMLRMGYDVWLGNSRGNEYVTYVGQRGLLSSPILCDCSTNECRHAQDTQRSRPFHPYEAPLGGDISFFPDASCVVSPEGAKNPQWDDSAIAGGHPEAAVSSCSIHKEANVGEGIERFGPTSLTSNQGAVPLLESRTSAKTSKLKNPCSLSSYLSGDTSPSEDWSFEDMARYDTPAMLQCVTTNTGCKKILCLGQSQGAAQLLVAVALNSGLCEIIKGLQLFAPPVVLNKPDSYTALVKLLIWLGKTCPDFTLQAVAIFRRILPPFALSQLANIVAGGGMRFYLTEVNDADRRIIFKHTPSGGTSRKNFQHWHQLILKGGVLSSYSKANGDSSLYPFHNITCPMHIYFGQKDNLVNVDASIQFLKKQFPGSKCKVEVFREWSHVDFGWGSQRYRDFYPRVIASVEKMCA